MCSKPGGGTSQYLQVLFFLVRLGEWLDEEDRHIKLSETSLLCLGFLNPPFNVAMTTWPKSLFETSGLRCTEIKLHLLWLMKTIGCSLSDEQNLFFCDGEVNFLNFPQNKSSEDDSYLTFFN